MRVYFATHPNRHLQSVIPAGIASSCDVRDAVWSTNITRDGSQNNADWPFGIEVPERWATAIEQARVRNTVFVVDCELYRTALDLFVTDRPKWEANLERVGKCVEMARAAAPGVRIGIYANLPSWTGYNIGQEPKPQRIEQLKLEYDRLKRFTDFNVIEADVASGLKPLKALSLWEDMLDDALLNADLSRETFVLTPDVTYPDSVYMGDLCYRTWIQAVHERGLKPMVWRAGELGGAERGWEKVIRPLTSK